MQLRAGADDDAVLADQFEQFVRDQSFPCVGAKSALARGNLKMMVANSLLSGWDDLRIHDALLEWAWDYTKDLEQVEAPEFRSLAVIFRDTDPMSEESFEEALWQRIQSLSDKDAWRGQGHDTSVSADPDDPHFSLSFGGQAFFVVGLHPHASRPARRFHHPVLVFNLHDQFELLRERGKYETMRDTILKRDIALAGDVNPMLSRHGETSEARQYSGRIVDEDWRCPFQDPRSSSRQNGDASAGAASK
ncbi:guanitoxin biosynthesis heme-dependent pre-guanitoxin N-hydroxylase GntA [Croceicoccus sp. F390]|uniref:Guanitoxin biosynthesis heme-dependent pre-guanitoxin N-hydroxylase GntA n=1 Tax=Croceicoccus esteveae TaxID=3075597 RepID=A0ABU2ZDI0_9SPHN|nr:guanitoxin biosynthesis heme-dependent pre-guanitoxin N-hydroxylase GntA [Croceicoccus sp. F390]MDT0574663.1 guanitoxin biosynthesis heme-dependent pre-guanitoxin N-hydroxylase GntA [Croceicoccus sp. F390]